MYFKILSHFFVYNSSSTHLFSLTLQLAIILFLYFNFHFVLARVPQIQIKSNIGSIWIWSNQIDPNLNLIWFKYLDLNLIWIFNSNFQIKSNICQIKSNLARFEFDQIKYSQIWIWSNIWFKYLKIKSNCGTLGLTNPSGLTGLKVWEAGIRTGRIVEVGAGVGANLTRA